MENRRGFLKTSTLSLLGAPFIPAVHSPLFDLVNNGPLIKQPNECEAVYVRENTLITFHLSKSTDHNSSISINDTAYPFKPGTTGFVPRDTFHGIKNTGTQKVSFFFGYSPSGFEDFFRQIGPPKARHLKQRKRPKLTR